MFGVMEWTERKLPLSTAASLDSAFSAGAVEHKIDPKHEGKTQTFKYSFVHGSSRKNRSPNAFVIPTLLTSLIASFVLGCISRSFVLLNGNRLHKAMASVINHPKSQATQECRMNQRKAAGSGQNLNIQIESISTKALESNEDIDWLKAALGPELSGAITTRQCHSMSKQHPRRRRTHCDGVLGNGYISFELLLREKSVAIDFFTYGLNIVLTSAVSRLEARLFQSVEPPMNDTPSISWSITRQGRYIKSTPNINHYFDVPRRFPPVKAQHEALVHPGMFAHPEPRKVALIGAEYNLLDEVLKHRSVQNVTVFEGEQEALGARSYKNIETDSYIEDVSENSIEIVSEDIMAWIGDRFYRTSEGKENMVATEDFFDVILLNAMECHKQHTDVFTYHADSLFSALSKFGVLVVPLGNSPFYKKSEMRCSSQRMIEISKALSMKSRFKSTHIFEESHGSLNLPQSYLIACKSIVCDFHWYLNEAYVNFEITKRIHSAERGRGSLAYFDGNTMSSYQRPPKSWQTWYCHQITPKPDQCNAREGFDPFTPNVPAHEIEVRPSSLGENVGRGVFSKVDIVEGSYMMQETAVNSVQFPPPTYNAIDRMDEMDIDVDALCNYMEGYGYNADDMGPQGSFVDSGINTFMNHGCNGTYNFGSVGLSSSYDDPTKYMTEEVMDLFKLMSYEDKAVFNPLLDRHLEHGFSSYDGALRNISKGEELFANYVFYVSVEDASFHQYQENLRAECRGDTVGLVVEVDTRHESSDDST